MTGKDPGGKGIMSLLDKVAEVSGLSVSIGRGWEILSTNYGRVLYREFSDYDGGAVTPPGEDSPHWSWRVTVGLHRLLDSGVADTAQEAMSAVEEVYGYFKDGK